MDWEIGKFSPACAACGKAFEEGQDIYSALFDRPEGFARQDYCAPCRPSASGAAEGASAGGETPLAFWFTRIPPRDAPAKRFVDDEVMLDLFRRLEGHADPQKLNFRYVLGLLLMRKKLLKFVEFRREESGDRLVLQERAGGASHSVADPNLSEEEIERLTGEVGQILRCEV